MDTLGIKYTYQGLMIYCAMAVYLIAFAALLAAAVQRSRRLRLIGMSVYAAGFAVSVAAFVYRWVHVQYVPLQNMFEVFLCMGMLVFLISVISRKFLRVGGEVVDALLAVVVLFPAGFVNRFSDGLMTLPPQLQTWLFAPHVAVYMFAYVILAKAAVQAVAQLVGLKPDEKLVSYEVATYRTVCLGFPLLTLGLVLGCWWAQIAWGNFWGWDPKELWSLVSWLVYAMYLHFRYMFGKRYKAVNASLAITGLLAILITLLWANLSKLFEGLHSYA